MYKVLLVDDEKMARTGLRATFAWEQNGFHLVGEASNGKRAMEWVEKKEVDVLITDIAMPVMDGLELTRRTKEMCPWVKILLLSCHNEFNYVREGFRLGASDYLLKATMETEDLAAIFKKLKAELDQERGTDNGHHGRIVRQALDYLQEHYAEAVTLQEIADHTNISKNYLSELIKKVTGRNFIHHLIEIRIERSKHLLTTTTLRIYEIAEQCGFQDEKYFSKLFKKIEKRSPAEFRG